MFGTRYANPLLAKALHDVYMLFPDEVFKELYGSEEVWDHRKAAARALAEVLVSRKIAESLLAAIEAEVRTNIKPE
jgi:hypothetical protein